MLIFLSTRSNHLINNYLLGTASSSTPTPALLVSASASAPPSDPPISEGTCNPDCRESNPIQHTYTEQVEDDDEDMISLGSDTELGG